ncbi:MAG: leucyl/phenylalanyl-tRNA--protein transferase [Bacteroidales bacterium]|nr:leucyl/phenylalanyl-tRNA--protein transferase [Bacteroidales bacterium]MBN2820525.1 leucyl/phenylalanyl-tRNA--protein transferase [Bacteroidales bacterium]
MQAVVQFPDPNTADDDGLVAVGGELTSDFLISAYMQGIFPWFSEEQPYLWWSPNPRMVLFPSEFKVSKSLRQLINSGKYELRIDTAFKEVITQCSKVPRPGQDGTWITDEMIEAYSELHKIGITHSFETWFEDRLAGGLYGISIGKVFFGESMFFKERDASKFALYYLVQFCCENNFEFIDVQQSTAHLRSLGAKEMPRTEFLKILHNSVNKETIQGKWIVSR